MAKNYSECVNCEFYKEEVEKLKYKLKEEKMAFLKEKSLLELKVENLREENLDLNRRLIGLKEQNKMIMENFEMKSVHKNLEKVKEKRVFELEIEMKNLKENFLEKIEKMKNEVIFFLI